MICHIVPALAAETLHCGTTLCMNDPRKMFILIVLKVSSLRTLYKGWVTNASLLQSATPSGRCILNLEVNYNVRREISVGCTRAHLACRSIVSLSIKKDYGVEVRPPRMHT